MIHMPRRSVTRYFIPLIDVLLLLFCIFLLMPTANESKLESAIDRNSDLSAEIETVSSELDRRTEDLKKFAANELELNNIQELKNQIEQLLKDRRGWQERTMFHIINVDPKTAAISYQDADSKTPTVIASREIAGKLIERHKKESENQPGEKRELYYYFLYPRPQPLDFPNRGQEAKLREYKKWFDEAKVANSLKENFP